MHLQKRMHVVKFYTMGNISIFKGHYYDYFKNIVPKIPDMERAIEERLTSPGKVKIKVIKAGERVVRTAPEYEECRRIARESGIPLLEVYRIVEREAVPVIPNSLIPG